SAQIRLRSRRVGMAAARPLVPQPAAFGAAAKAKTKAKTKQDEASDHGNPLHGATIADLM
ncbi:MAG: hypothetical protein WB489_18100, partial [Pseudolabrys sp.]